MSALQTPHTSVSADRPLATASTKRSLLFNYAQTTNQMSKVLADVSNCSTVQNSRKLAKIKSNSDECKPKFVETNAELTEIKANKRQMSRQTAKRKHIQTQFPEIEEKVNKSCAPKAGHSSQPKQSETTRKQLQEIGSMLDKLELLDAMIAHKNELLERRVESVKRKQWCAHCLQEANPIYYCCPFGDYCSAVCRDTHRNLHAIQCFNRKSSFK